ncbi:UvrD-helicase domain-containing protein [Chitinispirillales bacterium ANBcel5]|uniref:UvrD-helicase domain-containing protein n=1 Tax=Cellulosispirillum alkaliphilum TaxID=3039283 RepID=UPI002A56E260|nr:UvrD-helicase domain-containing protein [Chitinispirillales bacterium ANBcel5]
MINSEQIPVYLQMIPESASSWKHGVIEASAGTGKTYNIENLLIELLKLPPEMVPGEENRTERLNLSEILVVTFTEKATGELKTRIREKIECEIEALDKRHRALHSHLQDCLNRFDEASIFTIHGFCKKFLDSFAFESKLSLGPELRDEHELVLQFTRDWIRKGGLEKIDKTMAQRLLAGGPEKFITTLNNIMVHTECKEDVLLPFSDQLAADLITLEVQLQSHLQQLTDEDRRWFKEAVKHGVITTDEIVKKTGKAKTYKLPSSLEHCFKALVTAKAPKDILASSCNFETFNLHKQKKLSKGILKYLLKRFGDLFLSVYAFGVSNYVESWHKVLKDCRTKYSEFKTSGSLITFSDMIRKMRQELSSRNSLLLQALRDRFKFGIIDEFQDTNENQWTIFRRIFVDDQPTVLKRVLYVVGDRKQSIYSFQGADVQTCLKAMEELSGDERKCIDRNYRSTPAMIYSYNELFSSSWFVQERYNHVLPGKNDSQFPALFNSKTVPWGDAPLVLFDLGSEKSNEQKKKKLVELTVDTIKDLVQSKGIKESDICVLFEKNSEMLPVLNRLREEGVRATLGSEKGLFESIQCLNVICLLRSIAQPENAQWFKNALITEFFSVGIERFSSDSDCSGQEWSFYRDKLQKWFLLMRKSQYEQLLHSIIQDTNLYARIINREDGPKAISAYRQILTYTLKQLRNENLTFTQTVSKLYQLYKGELSESEEEEMFYRETSLSSVQLMTLHKAKGLQFPVVFLCTGIGGQSRSLTTCRVRDKDKMRLAISPLSDDLKSRVKEQEINERRRLWYVGLTRASHLQFAPHWNLEKKKECTAGWFLDTAFEELLKRQQQEQPHTPWVASVTKTQPENKDGIRKETEPVQEELNLFDTTIPEEELERRGVNNRRRIQTSYTSLAHGYTNSGHLLSTYGGRIEPGDENNEVIVSAKEREVFWENNLPPGAKTGNILHAVFEQIDFAVARDSASPEEMLNISDTVSIIDYQLQKQQLGSSDKTERRFQVAQIVWNTLNASVPLGQGESIRLADLSLNEKISELEYYYTFNRRGVSFCKNESAGTVFGFMDLVFLYNNKYWVLDWKSNLLPDYEEATIHQAMIDQQYTLQAALYAGALNQYLLTFKGSENYSLGGAIYMFLRGPQAGNSSGVWVRDFSWLQRAWDEALEEFGNKTIGDRLAMLAGGEKR